MSGSHRLSDDEGADPGSGWPEADTAASGLARPGLSLLSRPPPPQWDHHKLNRPPV